MTPSEIDDCCDAIASALGIDPYYGSDSKQKIRDAESALAKIRAGLADDAAAQEAPAETIRLLKEESETLRLALKAVVFEGLSASRDKPTLIPSERLVIALTRARGLTDHRPERAP